MTQRDARADAAKAAAALDKITGYLQAGRLEPEEWREQSDIEQRGRVFFRGAPPRAPPIAALTASN